ncbi:MAG: bifunctional 23S rRNA (guanine(2069)-N(7))-methyltransferase RlmK/23S rRNA (guanine(2445)-N(2))-methyltransferase RlmL [bacterium]
MNFPAPDFANRLLKNARHLYKWRSREDVNCYRLYDADLPEYAFAIDLYEGDDLWVYVQEYKAPPSIDPEKVKLRRKLALETIREVLNVTRNQVFLRLRERQRGSNQYEKRAELQQFHQIEEGGLKFEVNFYDYLDTGIFLDHRKTRKLIHSLAKGKSFLNLFAYTGSASVYAAAGGACATCTVDMSNTYISWAKRNMALNDFEGEQHSFIQADCIRWLKEQWKHTKYDLIFLDPPSFSSSKRMKDTFDVQRDHIRLINQALKLLDEDGVLIFSTNKRQFVLDQQRIRADLIKDLSKQTIPPDFSRNGKIHKCWKIQKPTSISSVCNENEVSRKPNQHIWG